MAPVGRLFACSCMGPALPCAAAGSSAAVFTGTVLEIVKPAPIAPAPNSLPDGRIALQSRRVGGGSMPPPPLRTVRMQVNQVLNGVAPGQTQIDIVTGMGGGDCGYSFQNGVEYVVYAYQNSDGRLQTGICSRTRPAAEAPEDLEYFRAKANAPETGEIRVRTGLGMSAGRPGVLISVERDGARYQALTNAAGEAVFSNMPPGAYTIHRESDGDLSDDPTVRLNAKGCLDTTLFRTLRITGRVTTKSGDPAARIEVELRSADDKPDNGAMTNRDGHYEIRVFKPGDYYLGVNLNHSPSRDTPYPRWFYPGTADPAAAIKIDFDGRPETRTYDLSLPDRQPERVIDGIVLTADGQPRPRAVVSLLDDAQNFAAQAIADPNGRFTLRAFTGTAYRLHATWAGDGPNRAVSAVPLSIDPDTSPLSLRLILTQPGNSVLDERRR